MKRILVVYYSQSGDAAAAVEAFVKPLRDAGAAVTMEQIRPTVEYPFPWKSFGRFFDVFPECVLGRPPAIHPLSVNPDERFDLVILAYQIWFLAPSLPAHRNPPFLSRLRRHRLPAGPPTRSPTGS